VHLRIAFQNDDNRYVENQRYILLFVHLCVCQFLVCVESIDCWRKANLWHILVPILLEANGLEDIISRISGVLTTDQLHYFSVIVWSIGKKRNLALGDETRDPTNRVLARNHKLSAEWRTAHGQDCHGVSQHYQQHMAQWTAPTDECVKCNLKH